MRHALGFLMAVAFAACGGGPPKPQPLVNVAPPPPPASWTVDRVFETIDPEAGVVIYADVDVLKANELVAGLAERIEKGFADQLAGSCDDVSMSGELVASASMDDTFDFTVWGIGGSTEPWLQCLRANATAKGMQVTTDGDYLTTSTGKVALSYLLLDRETVILAASTRAITRGEMVERTKPRSGERLKTVIQKLRGSGLPIWAAARGSSPLFSSLPIKFQIGTMTIGVKDRIDIDVDVGMTAKDQATMLAQTIQQQGQPVVQMGFLSALDAKAVGEALVVHAELSKASIDKILSMAAAMGGSKPFGPPPTP